MPRPYNFFQFGTGAVGSGGIGLASINPLFDGLTGFGVYAPPGLVGFPIDYFFPLDLEIHNNPFTSFLKFNANILSTNPHDLGISNTITGKIYPVSHDTASFYTLFSGNIPRDNIDTNVYFANYTGQISKDNIDQGTYISIYSGRAVKPFSEKFSYSSDFSGKLASGNIEIVNNSINISGNIVKIDKDKVLLNTDIFSIEWRTGNPKVTETSGDSISLSSDIYQIFWRRGTSV